MWLRATVCCRPTLLWRTPLSIFCRAGLVVMNSSSFCLSGNVFISLSLLKDSFARRRSLDWQFSSFCILTLSGHCLVASMISGEKSTQNLGEPLCVMNCFSLAAFEIFFVFIFQRIDYNVSWCGSLGICPGEAH